MVSRRYRTPLFPITMAGARLPVRMDPPRLGEHTRELLAGLGYSADEIDSMKADGVVG